jgi:hypothetical protein
MAAGSASVDAVLADAVSKLDALNKRMDALEVGEKKIIKGDDDDDKKRDDVAKKADAKTKADDDDDDDDKKDDGISAPKNKILDSAKGASKSDAGDLPAHLKDDDGELEIKHEPEKKGDAKKADAKKADAKKADAKKVDAAKGDDDDDKKDDDDDDKKDDSVKADDFTDLRRQITDQQAMISRLEAMIKPRSDDEHAAFADAQARADAVYSGFGKRAPRPLDGEELLAYRKRLATGLKSHSSRWKTVKFARLDDETFSPIESQVYDDATTAAANPIDLEAGELRMITKVDPTTNQRTNVFYGKESFVKQMGRPGRRVASFRTLQSI